MKTTAVILAAGKSSRFGGECPKQFLKLNGITVLEYSIMAFEKCALIDSIIIVTSKENLLTVKNILGAKYKKITALIEGGKERSDSSLAALNFINEECKILFHDAARPLVSQKTILDCIEKLDYVNAVTAAVKTTDTILVCSDKIINSIPDREFLYNCQTPQGFKSNIIKKAYEKALKDLNFKASDDCGVINRYLPEEKIAIVDGSLQCLKITYKNDLKILEFFLGQKSL